MRYRTKALSVTKDELRRRYKKSVHPLTLYERANYEVGRFAASPSGRSKMPVLDELPFVSCVT